MAVPAFPHQQQIEEFAPPRGVVAPVEPPVPAFPHMSPVSRPRTVLSATPADAEMQSARRARRSATGADPQAVAAYLSGTRSASALEPAAPPDDAQEAKLARARVALSRQPDAERLMQAKVIETFRLRTAPAWRSEFTRGAPPVIRIAIRLHRLRLDLAAEPDPAARLVLLIDGDADIGSMYSYDERDASQKNEHDRSGIVQAIGALFGLDLAPDGEVGTEFFDAVSVSEETPA